MSVPQLTGVPSMTQIKRGLAVALMSAAFLATLDELAAEFADGLVVPPLRSVKRAELKQVTDLPAAEIQGVRSIPLGDGPWTSSYEHITAVRFFVSGDDEERITEVVERYVLASRRFFSQAPGDEMRLAAWLPGSTVAGLEDYDPIMQLKDPEPTLVKVGLIELHTRTVQ